VWRASLEVSAANPEPCASCAWPFQNRLCRSTHDAVVYVSLLRCCHYFRPGDVGGGGGGADLKMPDMSRRRLVSVLGGLLILVSLCVSVALSRVDTSVKPLSAAEMADPQTKPLPIIAADCAPKLSDGKWDVIEGSPATSLRVSHLCCVLCSQLCWLPGSDCLAA
jgi:hypothetical protein